MIYTREETNGVRWLEVNGGEFDYAWSEDQGLVSICYDYIMDRPDLGFPLRTMRGVRWTLTRTEIASIPPDDVEWLRLGKKPNADFAAYENLRNAALNYDDNSASSHLDLKDAAKAWVEATTAVEVNP